MLISLTTVSSAGRLASTISWCCSNRRRTPKDPGLQVDLRDLVHQGELRGPQSARNPRSHLRRVAVDRLLPADDQVHGFLLIDGLDGFGQDLAGGQRVGAPKAVAQQHRTVGPQSDRPPQTLPPMAGPSK